MPSWSLSVTLRITVELLLSAFFKVYWHVVFQLFRCYMFLAWQIVFWLLRGYLSKSNLDVCPVDFKGNRRLNWLNPVRLHTEWMFSLMVIYAPWDVYWRRIRLANCSKLANKWRLNSFSLVTGVWINRSSFDRMLTWPSVKLWSEQFLRNLSFVSLSLLYLFLSGCFSDASRVTALDFL